MDNGGWQYGIRLRSILRKSGADAFFKRIKNEYGMGMKRLWLAVCFVGCLAEGRAQMLALKTDALWDVAMVPNLGVELVMGDRATIGLSALGTHKPWGKDIKLYGLQPEFRYWFSGHPMFREFIGLGLIGANYDIKWGSEHYEGDAVGGGLTFGYAFYLSPHWNLECYGSFGAVWYDQKHYYDKDNYQENRRTGSGYALIPFKIGVSFSYILK